MKRDLRWVSGVRGAGQSFRVRENCIMIPSKYVILKSATGVEHAVIFPAGLNHSDVVSNRNQAVAAGFFFSAQGSVYVIDGMSSLSLNLPPRPQDRVIIDRTISELML